MVQHSLVEEIFTDCIKLGSQLIEQIDIMDFDLATTMSRFAGWKDVLECLPPDNGYRLLQANASETLFRNGECGAACWHVDQLLKRLRREQTAWQGQVALSSCTGSA